MMLLEWGYNINARGNRYILNGYDVESLSFQDKVGMAENIDEAVLRLEFLASNTRIGKIRTLVWPAEIHQQEESGWYHIPLSQGELCGLRKWLGKCAEFGIPVQLAWGPLWDAQYPHPNAPASIGFSSMTETLAAWKQSLRDLVTGPQPNNFLQYLSVDLFNEYNLGTVPESGPEGFPVVGTETWPYLGASESSPLTCIMAGWYRYASTLLTGVRTALGVIDIPFTVSSILDLVDSVNVTDDRTEAITARWCNAMSHIQAIVAADPACPMPTFAQAHWNGVTVEEIMAFHSSVRTLMVGSGAAGKPWSGFQGKSLVFGEIGADLTVDNIQTISATGDYVYLWLNRYVFSPAL